jgi:D-alanyl-D-alanine carboxypeptidase
MNQIRTILSIILLFPFFLHAQTLENYFQQKLDSLFNEHKDAIGVILHIECPDKNMSWTYSVGSSNKKTLKTLNEQQPVLVASNTKPYVAASILRLVEMNKVELDQPINKYLTTETNQFFEKSGYDFNAISVRHLMSHTSGINDYVDEDYFEFVRQNPQYNWKKKEQIKRSAGIGSPLFDAGTDFKYGDINYLLLTEIIEQATDSPFYASMKKLLKFEELKLKSTWFKNLEPYPANTLPLAHQYADKYDWDSYKLNPSWDLYGGGGIATTAKEAALFFQHLFEGEIIEDESILKEMYKYVLPKEKSNYCLGISNISFPNFTAYYHGGWWGTDVAYIPETNTSVAVFTLQKSKRDVFARLSIEFMGKLQEEFKDIPVGKE